MSTNPYLTSAGNLTAVNASPEFAPQMQDISRQQRIAQMLLQQGMQQPQGQMVSGRFVAPSFTQNLANLANIWAGKKLSDESEQKQIDLLNKYQEAGRQELANLLRAKEGVTEQRTPVAGPPTDEMIAKKQFTPEQISLVQGEPMNPLAWGMLAANAKYSPLAQSIGAEVIKQQFKEPVWEKTSIKLNGQEIQGVYDKRNPDVMATFRPYNASVDIPLATAQYSGIIPKGNTSNTMPNFGNFSVSSPVGQRNDPLSGLPQFHAGTDVKIPSDVSLSPSTIPELKKDVGGKVIRTIPESQSGGFGNMVEVQRPDGSVARYAHLNNINVQQGQTVDANTVYGNPGSTGKSTGVHLHYEVIPSSGNRLNQAPIAPTKEVATSPVTSSKYDLVVPKQFNTPKERDEWFAESRKPLTGEPLKMVTGAENTIGALRSFNNAIQTFNKADMLNPDKNAEMYGLTKNAILALKDAKGLGVLNKEDLPQLEAILRDPTDWKNILNSKELFQKLANKQIQYSSDVIANNYRNSYKEIPENKKNLLIQIDSEVKEQNKQKPVDLSKPIVYNSQAAAQAAGKSGKLKEGQKVVIGNQVFTWRND